ncbi:ALF repeat-containing protein [Streptomyces sp. BBFR109]|uniref:ALF repeat-containing protein n=1 Tax=Streptomyces sp. BBFR109 TaxID=3448172 RepID=UPI003F764BC4
MPRRASVADAASADSLTLPDTDRAKAVEAFMTGGQATKAAAAYALYGTDAEVQTLLTETLLRVTAEDNRVAIARSLVRAGKGTRREAVAALDDAIAAFLAQGHRPALLEDLSVATAIVSSTGGKGVRREASAALDAGTRQALETFLTDGQYDAVLEDARVQVSAMLISTGPEIRKYADRALIGTASDIP